MAASSERADSVLDGVIDPEALRFTAAEVSALTGVSPASMERLWHAAGFAWPSPTEVAFADSDVEIVKAFGFGCELFGEEGPLHFTRAMGVAMARVGHAAVSVFLVGMAESLRDTQEADQRAAYELAGESFNSLPPVLERLFRRHASRAVERWRQQRDAGERYDVQRLAIGFVDLVGFTAQTRDLSPTDLADLMVRFEQSAFESVTAAGGEVVKLIGDEVMFVADDADSGSRVALALTQTYASSDVTPRGGVAYGGVLARGGDFYGSVVNLAARLTALAAPAEVLVTADLRDAATSDEFGFEPAGQPLLKGFVEPVPAYALRWRPTKSG
ncbi:MAG TPA: adenylate/guanylate cyclase domain-containing protein [Mycobacteriales bacterium]|nr:adenylate/guanylate cyclase domain-containing protein [Mycobacteriales bacterium]